MRCLVTGTASGIGDAVTRQLLKGGASVVSLDRNQPTADVEQHVQASRAVGVWGVGGLGAHGVQLLRAVGACPLITVDPVPAARARALEFGADLALDPADPAFSERIRAATAGLGLDVAFDFAGVPAVRDQALETLALQGKLVLVGITDQPLTIAQNGMFSYLRQQLLGHYGSEETAVPRLIKLAAHGRVDFSKSISDVLPLERAAEAVQRLETKEGNPIRLVLRP